MTKKVPEAFQHQIEAFMFACDRDHSAMFMEQGTGKTKVAIMKARMLFVEGKIDRMLVISPNAVKDQWVTEQMVIHYPDSFAGIVWDGFNTMQSKRQFVAIQESDDLKVFSVNIEAFQSSSIDQYVKMFYVPGRTFIVVDESTRIRNGSRKPTGNRRTKRKGAISTNKILDMFEDNPYKMILTGTPTPKSPMDLWSQFEFLKKDYFGMDFFYFFHRYSITRTETFNGRRVTLPIDEKTYTMIKSRLSKIEKPSMSDYEEMSARFGVKTSDVIKIRSMDEYTPFKHLDELHDKIGLVTFFKKKSECLDLPEKLYSTLYVDLSKEEKKLYSDLKTKMYAEYGGKEINVTSKLIVALRLQMITGGLFPYPETTIKFDEDGEYYETAFHQIQIIGNSKLKVLLDDLVEVPETTFVIIWARFTGEIDMIHSALVSNGYTAEKYYGGSHISIIDRFKAGEFQFLVANPQKGGEGLNLQIATLQYFYSNAFMADKRLQAEDRSHRLGQRNPVYYKDLVCRGTIDERVLEVLKRRENLIDYFRTGLIDD